MAEIEMDKLYQAAWQAHTNGRHEESMSLLEQAISIATCAKVKSTYLTVKGGFCFQHNDYEEAVAACNEAILLVPNNYYALTQMGLAQMKLCAFASAASYFERAAKIRPSHNVLTMLAKSQLPTDPSAAKESAIRALELEPSWSEAKLVLEAAEEAERGIPD